MTKKGNNIALKRFFVQSIVFGFLLFILFAIIWKPFSHTTSLSNLHLLDFDNYLHLIVDIRHGLNPYTVTHMITLGPPLVILFYLPFSFFSIHTAQVLFITLNIISGLLACVLLSKTYNPRFGTLTSLLLAIFLFLSFPARFSLQIGQPNLILLLLITIVITSDSIFARSFSLALMTISKTFFLLVSLAFIRKNLKVALLSFSFILFAGLASFLICRPSWDIYYVTHTFKQVSLARSNDQTLDYYNQSWKSSFHRLYIDEFYLPFFVLFLLIGGILVVATKHVEYSVLYALLASPVLWQHYLTILFGLFVYVLFRSTKRVKWLVLLPSFFLWSINIPLLQTAAPTLVLGIIASHGLISALLLGYAMHLVDSKESDTLVERRSLFLKEK